MATPKVIIHGGFFSESITNNEVKKAKQDALLEIVKKTNEFLQNNTALETVVFANKMLEDNPLFNAGTGSHIQSDGVIRLSASLMDGKRQLFSGVINISNIQNPIELSRILIEEEDRVLSGEQAENYARLKNFSSYNPEIKQRRDEYEQNLATSRTSTVGCVALDADGNIAAGTSTGGKGFEIPGRVSDSATVAGNYATNDAGVSVTGVGEDILNASLASKIVTRVIDGMPLNVAVDKSFKEMKPYDGFAGIISIDKGGNIYHTDSHPYMVYAYHDGENAVTFS
ncbi:MAG: L-asparaginase [Sphingobacteriales bacterium]|jgi:L-asparaginase